jgi:hypothetical protein
MAKSKLVKEEESQEVVLITPEQMQLITTTIETKLAAENVTDQAIAKYRKEAMAMKIAGPEDKEGYEAVYEMRQKGKRTRIIAVDICKAGREPLQAEVDMWIKKQADIVALIKEPEAYLLAQETEYEAAKERVKQEKVAAITKRYEARVEQLTALGVRWSGSVYILDDLAYTGEVIRESEDDHFNEKILPQYRKIWESKEAIAKAHREAMELQEKQNREAREELERREKLLKEQQDALKKQQEEADRKKNEEEEKERLAWKKAADDKMKARLNQLTSLGLKYDFASGHYVNFDVFIHNLDITGYDDQKWDQTISATTDHIEKFKAGEAEKETARLKKEFDENVQRKVDEQKEKERLAEVKRQQEIEEGKESVRYAEMVKYLKNTPMYQFKSGRYITKARAIKDFIADLD